MMIDTDNELAEATDALLAKRNVQALTDENAELFAVVRELHRVIDPQTPPTAAFQQRLTSRLNTEWDRAYTPPQLRLMDRPVVRLLSMAAAVVLILASLMVLTVPETTPELQAAAIPLDDAAAVLVLVGVAAVGAFVYWRDRR